MGASGAVEGLFEPGDGVGRAWDEAEAVLLACDDLDAVMGAIRDAESPVEARRALKLGFGFTGRQAALLLTLPVLSFTRSERERMHESRRARVDLLADVTGTIPVVRDTEPEAPVERTVSTTTPTLPPTLPRSEPTLTLPPTLPRSEPTLPPTPSSDPTGPEPGAQPEWWTGWSEEIEGTLDRIRSVMDENYGTAPAGGPDEPPAGPANPTGSADPVDAADLARPGRRAASTEPEDVATVLDEQIGELCEAIADLLGVHRPMSALLDDPRASTSPTGQLLDSCGVDDRTGVRTLLWHLHRTGLESVEALLPFAEPLTGSQGIEVQAVRFESAMASGGLGSEPGGSATWVGRLWPLAERRGYGYAVYYRPGAGAGTVWAYGGGEPLHLLWDSVVDMLVELYQALTEGEPCDAALAEVEDGRMVWTNLS